MFRVKRRNSFRSFRSETRFFDLRETSQLCAFGNSSILTQDKNTYIALISLSFFLSLFLNLWGWGNASFVEGQDNDNADVPFVFCARPSVLLTTEEKSLTTLEVTLKRPTLEQIVETRGSCWLLNSKVRALTDAVGPNAAEPSPLVEFSEFVRERFSETLRPPRNSWCSIKCRTWEQIRYKDSLRNRPPALRADKKTPSSWGNLKSYFDAIRELHIVKKDHHSNSRQLNALISSAVTKFWNESKKLNIIPSRKHSIRASEEQWVYLPWYHSLIKQKLAIWKFRIFYQAKVLIKFDHHPLIKWTRGQSSFLFTPILKSKEPIKWRSFMKGQSQKYLIQLTHVLEGPWFQTLPRYTQ